MYLSLLGIIISMALLMILVFKRVNIIPATIISCVVLAIFSNINILNILSVNYLGSMAKFISSYFLIFASSALFGKLMDESGCSAAIANWICAKFGTRHAIYGGMIASALLSYSGVSAFVIAFTVLPIFLHIFQKSNLPRRLLPAAIFSSACTFTVAILSGSAQLTNIIPIQYLNTTPMAAPLVGIIPGIVTAILIFLYFEYEIKKAEKMGVGFDATEEILENIKKYNSVKSVNALLAFVPIIVLFVLLNFLDVNIFVSMLVGSLSCFLIVWRNIPSKLETLNQGIGNVTTVVINTASVVGLGGAIQATSGFEALFTLISNFGGNPLIALSVATTLVSGATGSSSGGAAIAMQVFSQNFLDMGLNPEIIHRIISVSSLGISYLPHNGVIISILSLTGFTHKEAYMPMFWTSFAVTIVAMIIAVVLGSIIYPI